METHGHTSKGQVSPEYKSWFCMKGRCLNPNSTNFRWYGARGIKICDRWLEFENFLADMGGRPPGKSLDRINNDGNYEPGNCRWATYSEQMANRKKVLSDTNCPFCKVRFRPHSTSQRFCSQSCGAKGRTKTYSYVGLGMKSGHARRKRAAEKALGIERKRL